MCVCLYFISGASLDIRLQAKPRTNGDELSLIRSRVDAAIARYETSMSRPDLQLETSAFGAARQSMDHLVEFAAVKEVFHIFFLIAIFSFTLQHSFRVYVVRLFVCLFCPFSSSLSSVCGMRV